MCELGVDFVSCWPEIWGDRAAVFFVVFFYDLWSQIKWRFVFSRTGMRQKGFHGTGTLCCLRFGLNMYWSGCPYLARQASLDPCWLGDQLISCPHGTESPQVRVNPDLWCLWIGRAVVLSMNVGVGPWSWRCVARFLKAVRWWYWGLRRSG